MKKPWVLSYPLNAQRRLWSDWVDAQADLSHHWAHMSFCWFCCAVALVWEQHRLWLDCVDGHPWQKLCCFPYAIYTLSTWEGCFVLLLCILSCLFRSENRWCDGSESSPIRRDTMMWFMKKLCLILRKSMLLMQKALQNQQNDLRNPPET